MDPSQQHNALDPTGLDIISTPLPQQHAGAVELGPTYVFGEGDRDLPIGNSGWGLQHGPRRGEGPGPTIRTRPERALYGVLMDEHNSNVQQVEDHYAQSDATLPSTVAATVHTAGEQARHAHRAHPVQSAKAAQAAVLALIDNRQAEYARLLPGAQALGGMIPFFLTRELGFRTLHRAVGLQNGRSMLDNYREAERLLDDTLHAAHQLKQTARATQLMTQALAELAAQADEAIVAMPGQPEQRANALNQQLETIAQTLAIQFGLLPQFLQQTLAQAAGVPAGNPLIPSLARYHAAALSLAQAERKAAGGYARVNPSIASPLSKPELIALRNLVHGQASGTVGPRWADYHVWLLHHETANHVHAVGEAIGILHARAARAAKRIAQLHASNTPGFGHYRYSGAQAGVVALLWPSSVGNSERWLAASVPLHTLMPTDGLDLHSLDSVPQPYTLGLHTQGDDTTLYVPPGNPAQPVPVFHATWDDALSLYSVRLDSPPRQFTWTPVAAPGSKAVPATPLPIEPPADSVYPGITLTPIEALTYLQPIAGDQDSGRWIVTFPADAGIGPLFIVDSRPPVDALEVGTYQDLSTRSRLDGMDVDPIPSAAALRCYLERSNKKLTSDQLKLLIKAGPSIAIPTFVHRSYSETYGGQNFANKQMVDAKNLTDAINNNIDAMKGALLDLGYTETAIEASRQALHTLSLSMRNAQ